MTGEQRRQNIMNILTNSKSPISGTALAKELGVSRQVIVTDMALLRAQNINVYSTHKGYVIEQSDVFTRVFKVHHDDEHVETELAIFVDNGAKVKDVFVYHKIYGILKADMDIKSRRDIKRYMEDLKNGNSSLLKNVTSGYHYHTVEADSEEILDDIQEELEKHGFLAKLQEFEPVEFKK